MFARRRRHDNQSGFTLIELAIIIAVLGILGAVGAMKFASMTDEALKAGTLSALSNARSALSMAVAKDADGKISETEFWGYLQGATTSMQTTTTAGANLEFTFENRYKIYVTGSQTNITGIASASSISN